MKDTVIVGATAGILSNIAKSIITWVLYYLGYTNYTFEHIAAGYFVDEKHVKIPIALITGFIGDYTFAAFIGIVTFLLLRFTGFDFAILKGLGIGALTYIIFFGVSMAKDFTRVSIMNPISNLLLFFPLIIFGMLTAWIIKQIYHKNLIKIRRHY